MVEMLSTVLIIQGINSGGQGRYGRVAFAARAYRPVHVCS